MLVSLKEGDATAWPWPSRDWPWPQIDAYLNGIDFPQRFRGNKDDKQWWPAELKRAEKEHVDLVSPFSRNLPCQSLHCSAICSFVCSVVMITDIALFLIAAKIHHLPSP